jgi:hypothetical protein
LKIKVIVRKLLPNKRKVKGNAITYFKPQNNYVLACTCKNTNPKANPNKVIKQQEIATLIISDINFD